MLIEQLNNINRGFKAKTEIQRKPIDKTTKKFNIVWSKSRTKLT